MGESWANYKASQGMSNKGNAVVVSKFLTFEAYIYLQS